MSEDPLSAQSPWPELSEYSCLSCHQRLGRAHENQALRLRNRKSRAGQPEWNPWFLVLPLQTASEGSSDSLPASFAAWGTLRTKMEPLMASNAQEVESSTEFVRRQLFTDFGFLANAGMWHSPPTFSQNDLIHAIRLTALRAESWESLCQIFLALQAAGRNQQDMLRRSAAHVTTNPARQPIFPPAMTEWHQNLESMRWSLAFIKGTDIPRALLQPTKSDGLPDDDVLPGAVRPMTLIEIRDLAVQLAEQLAAQTMGSKDLGSH